MITNDQSYHFNKPNAVKQKNAVESCYSETLTFTKCHSSPAILRICVLNEKNLCVHDTDINSNCNATCTASIFECERRYLHNL